MPTVLGRTPEGGRYIEIRIPRKDFVAHEEIIAAVREGRMPIQEAEARWKTVVMPYVTFPYNPVLDTIVVAVEPTVSSILVPGRKKQQKVQLFVPNAGFKN